MALLGPPGQGDRIARRLLVPLLVVLAAIVIPVWILHFPLLVEGDSMNPGLHSGDRVLVARWDIEPAIGDVVVVTASPQSGAVAQDQIKRVVAHAGQTVSIDRGRAVVDGQYEFLKSTIVMEESDVSVAELTVPDGHIYVLGDNRPVSLDSRFYGPVSLDSVKGRVTFVIAPITRFGRVD